MMFKAWVGIIFLACCFAVLPVPAARAQTYSPAAVRMFNELQRQSNDLARYVYLVKAIPKLPISDQPLAMQMLASTENELGLYNEALRDFPLKSRAHAGVVLPTPADWAPADAIAIITKLAADRRIVLINEAHHDAHTRQLTLALLPRLRKLGFDYFAVEALSDRDAELSQRGYPISTSGTEYLHEPSYGDIVRMAIKLGFKLVPYDTDGGNTQEREIGQANNLYRKVFAKDPAARLFVHAGYAHIDKAKGRLGKARPMAMELQQLTGIEPLSIDQTQFREQIPSEPDGYLELIKNFSPKEPIVLVNRETGKPWSSQPDKYDLNVILPRTAGLGAIDSGRPQASAIVQNTVRSLSMLAHYINTQRPEWLSLDNQRVPYDISSRLCKVIVPCVVDAHYINEPDDATAADRYPFMQNDSVSRLYLRPGRYRLRAWDIRGRTLSKQIITIDGR